MSRAESSQFKKCTRWPHIPLKNFCSIFKCKCYVRNPLLSVFFFFFLDVYKGHFNFISTRPIFLLHINLFSVLHPIHYPKETLRHSYLGLYANNTSLSTGISTSQSQQRIVTSTCTVYCTLLKYQ